MTTTTEIMEQAQVFASAWSLVGGQFDDGTMHDTALEEKAILQSAIEALVRDAERYRWLRGNYDDSLVMVGGDKGCAELYMEEQLDRAIDAAIAQEEKAK